MKVNNLIAVLVLINVKNGYSKERDKMHNKLLRNDIIGRFLQMLSESESTKAYFSPSAKYGVKQKEEHIPIFIFVEDSKLRDSNESYEPSNETKQKKQDPLNLFNLKTTNQRLTRIRRSRKHFMKAKPLARSTNKTQNNTSKVVARQQAIEDKEDNPELKSQNPETKTTTTNVVFSFSDVASTTPVDVANIYNEIMTNGQTSQLVDPAKQTIAVRHRPDAVVRQPLVLKATPDSNIGVIPSKPQDIQNLYYSEADENGKETYSKWMYNLKDAAELLKEKFGVDIEMGP